MNAHLELAVLVEYWFGELQPRDEEALEEHLFGCAHCIARLEELVALGAGIRAAFRSGALHLVPSRDFVERLRREGLRLREYRVPAGGSVQCTITAEDDFVVSRLQAALSGVERLNLVVLGAGGEARETLEDIPFDPAAGEVLIIPSAAALRACRAPFTDRMRLVAVDSQGETVIADYTFMHTPS